MRLCIKELKGKLGNLIIVKIENRDLVVLSLQYDCLIPFYHCQAINIFGEPMLEQYLALPIAMHKHLLPDRVHPHKHKGLIDYRHQV